MRVGSDVRMWGRDSFSKLVGGYKCLQATEAAVDEALGTFDG